MKYCLRLRIDALHFPTRSWDLFSTTIPVNAVSRKHALNKALAKAQTLPEYQNREGSPEWKVWVEAHIIPS